MTSKCSWSNCPWSQELQSSEPGTGVKTLAGSKSQRRVSGRVSEGSRPMPQKVRKSESPQRLPPPPPGTPAMQKVRKSGFRKRGRRNSVASDFFLFFSLSSVFVRFHLFPFLLFFSGSDFFLFFLFFLFFRFLPFFPFSSVSFSHKNWETPFARPLLRNPEESCVTVSFTGIREQKMRRICSMFVAGWPFLVSEALWPEAPWLKATYIEHWCARHVPHDHPKRQGTSQCPLKCSELSLSVSETRQIGFFLGTSCR